MRMVETAALFCAEVLSERPLWQWVLSLLYALRFLLEKAAPDQSRAELPLGARAPPTQARLI